ncbi:MAG: chemotaxis protein [Pyramidobacter sp.]|nr:chemotaxis protein [Pyramidobacter sp.]MBQ8129416.1 chemotaxis protein [Clostridia bacterium]
MRDTIAGWTTARKEADIRQQALEALRDELAAQSQQMKRDLADLQREISAERKLWRSRIRRGKMQGVMYGVLIGFSSGYLVKRNNP